MFKEQSLLCDNKNNLNIWDNEPQVVFILQDHKTGNLNLNFQKSIGIDNLHD